MTSRGGIKENLYYCASCKEVNKKRKTLVLFEKNSYRN